MRYSQLTQEERYTINRLKEAKFSNREVAEITNRHKSTIGRELKRNSTETGHYIAHIAQDQALKKRKKSKKPKKLNEYIKSVIKNKLEDKWAPEQIAAYLGSDGKNICHELIYQYIYQDRKEGGKLYKKLRHSGRKYRSRNCIGRIKIKNRKGIENRPSIVEEKKRIGDWEGDTIIGKGHKSSILTIVDRKSKYLLIRKLLNHSSDEMNEVILKTFKNGIEFFKTLTVDNGLEFAGHEEISRRLMGQVYFATPYSPWERGLNENTNGLIRQFFPKGTDFREVTEDELLHAQQLINNRPRKTLGYKTPIEVFTKELKSINKYRVALAS